MLACGAGVVATPAPARAARRRRRRRRPASRGQRDNCESGPPTRSEGGARAAGMLRNGGHDGRPPGATARIPESHHILSIQCLDPQRDPMGTGRLRARRMLAVRKLDARLHGHDGPPPPPWPRGLHPLPDGLVRRRLRARACGQSPRPPRPRRGLVPLVPRDGGDDLQGSGGRLPHPRRASWPSRVDQDARPDLSNRYEDYGWPATVVFDAAGQELVKIQGYIEPERMRGLLRAVIADPTPGRFRRERGGARPWGEGRASPTPSAAISRPSS
mgnify:CR=1 FL=1